MKPATLFSLIGNCPVQNDSFCEKSVSFIVHFWNWSLDAFLSLYESFTLNHVRLYESFTLNHVRLYELFTLNHVRLYESFALNHFRLYESSTLNHVRLYE